MFVPGQAAPASPNASPTPSANPAVMQLRKALGLPEDQPAPEQKVIDACMGKLGPDIKRIAVAVAGPGPSLAPPVTADPGQAGGEPSPPPPNGPDTGDSPAVQPGEQTGGKMGAATIFGKRPVSAIGGQPPLSEDEQEDDEEMPGAHSMFGKGR